MLHLHKVSGYRNDHLRRVLLNRQTVEIRHIGKTVKALSLYLILNPHPKRLVGFQARVLVIDQLPVKSIYKHDILHAVNIIDQLPDAFIRILTLHFRIVDRLQAGTADQDLQIIDCDEQPGISAHMDNFRQGTQHMPGIVFCDPARIKPHGAKLRQLHRPVALQPRQEKITILFLEDRIAQHTPCQHAACQRKVIIQHGIVQEYLLKLCTDLPLRQRVSHSILRKIVNEFHAFRNLAGIKTHFLYKMMADSLQAVHDMALIKNLNVYFPEIMHPDIPGRKMDGFIILILREPCQELQKICLSAALTPRHKFDLASAVPDIFPEIFFLPEIAEETDPAG